MELKKRAASMRVVFLKYLVTLAVAFVAIFALYSVIISFFYKAKVILPPNYSENLTRRAKPIIKSAKEITEDMIPGGCKFAVLDKSYRVVKTNLSSEDVLEAKQYAEGKYENSADTKQYYFIERSDGSCVLQYYIMMRYNSDFLNENLPKPERMLISILVLLYLIFTFIISTFYARKLKKHLNPLLEVAKKIKEQDLDFKVTPSEIKEFNEVLLALSDMKEELKKSLKQQWDIEQSRREQISSLAHDIKTPLTIIKGNSELLCESQLNEEQAEYTNFINKNTNQIEEYIKMLIDMSKSENNFYIQVDKVDSHEFVTGIYTQLKALAATKKLQVQCEEKSLPLEITIDPNLLYRAIMNIISNAVDYCPIGGKIYFGVESVEENICFKIEDSGKGFSNRDMECATKQFYTGDKSRSSKTHYGMGMYITDSIVKRHDGSIYIRNSPITGGAQVIIKIPISLATF